MLKNLIKKILKKHFMHQRCVLDYSHANNHWTLSRYFMKPEQQLSNGFICLVVLYWITKLSFSNANIWGFFKESLCYPHFKDRESSTDMWKYLLRVIHLLSAVISLSLLFLFFLLQTFWMKYVRFQITGITEDLQVRLCYV